MSLQSSLDRVHFASSLGCPWTGDDGNMRRDNSDILDEVKAEKMGVKAYLLKPLDRSKLAMAVRKALDG